MPISIPSLQRSTPVDYKTKFLQYLHKVAYSSNPKANSQAALLWATIPDNGSRISYTCLCRLQSTNHAFQRSTPVDYKDAASAVLDTVVYATDSQVKKVNPHLRSLRLASSGEYLG
eukprot:gb/GECG01004709.1/.p1 GENE.gb/GECG01004709.1/~~gb/GECG01004709.1/.p1  ORF type:complete len:116 (+),score=8.69 gb/GECG01004709.1/:1-348(+)